jgi:hypothetical protein
MESLYSSSASDSIFEGGNDNILPLNEEQAPDDNDDVFNEDQINSSQAKDKEPSLDKSITIVKNTQTRGKSFYKKKSTAVISMKEHIDKTPQTVENLVDKYRQKCNVNDSGAVVKFNIESKILLHPHMNILLFVSKNLLVIVDLQDKSS